LKDVKSRLFYSLALPFEALLALSQQHRDPEHTMQIHLVFVANGQSTRYYGLESLYSSFQVLHCEGRISLPFHLTLCKESVDIIHILSCQFHNFRILPNPLRLTSAWNRNELRHPGLFGQCDQPADSDLTASAAFPFRNLIDTFHELQVGVKILRMKSWE